MVQAGLLPSTAISNSSRAIKTYRNVLKQLQKLPCGDSQENSAIHIEWYTLSSIEDLGDEIDINAADKHGITPLHIVSYTTSKPHVKFLLEKKADANKKDKTGLTALHFAAFKGMLFLNNS